MTAGPDQRGCVVFDVDGTLLDTNYLQVVAWWEAFRERGYDVRSADIHRALGKDSAELVEEVLGRGDDSVIAAHSRHMAPYLGRMRALPGAAALLTATARLGPQVVIATSAKPDEVDLMLDAIGAREAISEVLSSGDVDRAKPAPDIITAALEATGTPRRWCVMVGDTIWDIISADRAGVRSIGVLSGGIAEQELRSAGASAIYADAAALLDNLASSIIGQLA
jgi:phosphoglycolate phosphatase-like HAD superfamily hydrolase